MMIYHTFTQEDQNKFAILSGDNNPLHIDALAARRSMFGRLVVHGMHGVLRALDYALASVPDSLDSRIELRSLKAVFHRAIHVDDALETTIIRQDDSLFHIRILSDNTTTTKITASWSPLEVQDADAPPVPQTPAIREPRVLSDDEIAIDSGVIELPLDLELAAVMFPKLAKCLPPIQLATILHMSRLVGVYCPGLHSLFSEIELFTAPDNDESNMQYSVAKFDKRIGLVTLKVRSPRMTGTIKAFRRPAPKQQMSYLELRDKVSTGEFADQRALIIGGSRGLGEVTAKLLAAGGANVNITYHLGSKDAQAIVEEIVSHGGNAQCFQYDVLNPAPSAADILASGWQSTHLYYFATPFIFSGVKRKFSPDLFRLFCDYYVAGLAQALHLLSDHTLKKVFYPSSVAVDELPVNMGEYSAAKIASELLCEFLEKCHPGLDIHISRLPRTDTDQTVSIMPVKSEDAAALMIRELRAFHAI